MHIDEEIVFPGRDRNVDCFAYLLNIHERKKDTARSVCVTGMVTVTRLVLCKVIKSGKMWCDVMGNFYLIE